LKAAALAVIEADTFVAVKKWRRKLIGGVERTVDELTDEQYDKLRRAN
jgi:hypothetical protein